MSYSILYYFSAGLSILGTLGHTFGGMLGTVRKKGDVAPKAKGVYSRMRSVHFKWRGADSTWFNWWFGNGLGVTALMVLAVVVFCVLGGLSPVEIKPLLPIAWAAFVSFVGLSVLGFKYFAPMIGSVFGLIALLSGIAAILASLG